MVVTRELSVTMVEQKLHRKLTAKTEVRILLILHILFEGNDEARIELPRKNE